MLGELDWKSRGLVMETKFFPTAGRSMSKSDEPEGGWRHTPEHLRQNLKASLQTLKTDKVDMWYLHGPDRSTPYEVTMKAVNDLYKEGYFNRLGLSNFMSWEVAQICEICEKNGWIKPSVYQGVYNGLQRAVERELFPCLRHYGMSFYGYNPLAGGYLTDRYHRDDKPEDHEAGSRFDPSRMQGKMYRMRYWNDAYFDALDILRPVAKKHGLTEAECALRWSMHHSVLRKEKGDAIIIGASSVKHMVCIRNCIVLVMRFFTIIQFTYSISTKANREQESNMENLEKGPLPDEVVEALNQGWDRCKGNAIQYWL